MTVVSSLLRSRETGTREPGCRGDALDVSKHRRNEEGEREAEREENTDHVANWSDRQSGELSVTRGRFALLGILAKICPPAEIASFR